VRAVLISLGVLGAAAAAQALVFVLSGSVALLADLIHNAGDALTALPVGAAFLLRSTRAERWAGYAVVFAILISACVALYETVLRLLNPQELEHLWVLAGAGIIGYVGNQIAARVPCAPAIGSAAPRSSPTATTPASMPLSASASSPAPAPSRSGSRSPIRSSVSRSRS
jgi:hypothetical protein